MTTVAATRNALTLDDFVPDPEFAPWYEAALSFSPGGEQLAYIAGSTDRYAIYRHAVAGGEARLVTDGGDWYVHTAFWSPDGRWIAYNAAADGAEAFDIFLIAPDGTTRVQVTDVPEAAHRLGPACWSPDGRYLVYSANDRRPGAVDLLCYDVEAGTARRLLAGDHMYHAGSWSPDGRRLLAVEERPLAASSLLLVDVATGATQRLTDPGHGVAYVPGPFLPDGNTVALLTNAGGEFLGLATLDVTTREIAWLAAPSWDVERVVAANGGRTLAWTVNENGYSRLYLRHDGGDAAPVPDVPAGVVHGLALSPDGTRAAVVTSGVARTYELSVLDVPRRSLRRLVGELPPRIRDLELVEAEPVRYASVDGVPVHGYLMRPAGRERAGVVVSLHGGPHAQERPNYGYSGMYQYLVSQGVGVFLPNIRGSSGYGASFERLLVRRYGCEDVSDVEAANAYLRSLPWVDPERIGLFGFCYGGFVALGALARDSSHWAAAACWGATCDLLDLITGGVPEEYEARVATIGHPVRDRDELIERSPLTHADRIRAPLFLIHGRQDIYVPHRQSDQLAERVRANGVPVEYQTQDGHGFVDANSLLTACRDTSAFLITHLAPAGRG